MALGRAQMTPAARVAAAIEVLTDIATRRRPAPDALKDWGLSHRFAGSGDRAAIAGLVYDGLRRRASSAWLMGDDSPRAVMIGHLAREAEANLSALFSGDRHAPPPLSAAEQARLGASALDEAPAHVLGDYPEWLDAQLAALFGEARAQEGAALARRAPLDLRANTLKADRDEVLSALAHLRPIATPFSPMGLRIDVPATGKSPAIQAEPAFLKGQVEIQDEGSQVAALLCAPDPGMQVIDLCAGAGGKTLELAALMNNTGQIFATDNDKRRLVPIHERLERAGVRNTQVRTPRERNDDALRDLKGRADLVVVDAPCTGSGTWRRNPDAKWRLRPGALTERLAEQAAVLDRAADLVRPGGEIAYITCSLLPAENGDQIEAALSRHPQLALVAPASLPQALGPAASAFARAVHVQANGVQMTPLRTGTDGFFVARLKRRA
jgi:16S rRNA (cytosine967-C5)-methyltransferase